MIIALKEETRKNHFMKIVTSLSKNKNLTLIAPHYTYLYDNDLCIDSSTTILFTQIVTSLVRKEMRRNHYC